MAAILLACLRFTLSLYGKWRLGDALMIPYMVNIVKLIRTVFTL